MTICSLDILLFLFGTSLLSTPFPIWNQAAVPCPVRTVASWPAYRFLKRQVRCSYIPSLSEFSTVYCDPHSQRLWHSQESRSRCFSGILLLLYDPTDVDNWISGSSAFSKSSLSIWKFLVHILLKPSLKDFENYHVSMWNDCNCAIVWIFFDIALFGNGMKIDIFQSCGHCSVFQICWHIEYSSFTASSFILTSLPGIPSPLLCSNAS